MPSSSKRDPKISYMFWAHCNSYMLSGLWWTSLMSFFFYMLPCFHQNLSHHFIIKQIPTMSIKFTMDIKSRPWLTWNADMWLTDLSNTTQVTLSLFHILNQIAKFNSWKLIAARWILCQCNINVITRCFKCLIQQVNLTSEWDLILQSGTQGVMNHSNF